MFLSITTVADTFQSPAYLLVKPKESEEGTGVYNPSCNQPQGGSQGPDTHFYLVILHST